MLKVVKTLVAGKEGKETSKILGYILEDKSGRKKGFTVEEAAVLIFENECVNAETGYRPIKDKETGEVTGNALYITGKGKNPDGTNFKLSQANLILPILTADQKPQANYSEALKELAKRRVARAAGGSKDNAKAKAERDAKINEILKQKKLSVSF